MKTIFNILRWIIKVLIFVLPWIVRAMIWSIWQSLMFFTTWWKGIPNSIELITDLWINRMHAGGVTTEFDPILQPTLRIIAFAALLAGWIIYSHITVLVFWLIFHR